MEDMIEQKKEKPSEKNIYFRRLNNLSNGYFEVKRVTIFIGDQGTGKITVAKLFSTFSWLEKAIYRGQYSQFISTNVGKDL